MKKQGRCFNCLRKGHMGKQCRSQEKCSKCKGKHHTALCREGAAGTKSTIQMSQEGGGGSQQRVKIATPEVQDSTPTSALLATSNSSVLLQTAKVKLITTGANPRCREVRALLDTGSHRTYVSEKVAKDLSLQVKDTRRMKLQTFYQEKEKSVTCDEWSWQYRPALENQSTWKPWLSHSFVTLSRTSPP